MKLALAAMILGLGASPAFAQEAPPTILFKNSMQSVTISVREAGSDLIFEGVSPPFRHISYEFDVNANGTVDERIDVGFAASEGEGCAQYRLTAQSSSLCGEYKTKGSFTSRTAGQVKTDTWRIPRSEVSRNGMDARLEITVWDEKSQRYVSYSKVYAFKTRP